MPLGFGDILIYVLSIVGLFTMSFYVLTIFSPRAKKIPENKSYFPKVSIIIPIWNEGASNGDRLRKTLNSLLNCNYPKSKLEIIVVNDGSTDNSLEIVSQFKSDGVKVFSHKKSLGKTRAVNTGIQHATGEFIAGLDADSFIEPDVITKLVIVFKDKQVMAAIPSIKIYKPKSILQKIQAQEFLSAIFVRYVQSELGSIPLAPGAFTMIRKTFLDKFGGLNPHTMVEDLEMSMRIQSEGYLIENVLDANVYTGGVKTLKHFGSQRLRWFMGFLIQMKKYKHLFNKKYGNLAFFILPSSIFFIFMSIFIFGYNIVMLGINFVDWIIKLHLIGFKFADLLDLNTDVFFLTVSEKILLPLLLLAIIYFFMLYMKKQTKEKSNVTLPFMLFMMTYWFLGSYYWLKALWYYVRGKPVKWGPNYFKS